jgi:bacteriorhodopsin
MIRNESADNSKNRKVYHVFMVLIATVPMLGLFTSFQQAQKLYTVTGAYFFPLLAIVLLLLNSRGKWVGEQFKYGPFSIITLVIVLVFFIWATAMNITF